MKHFWPHIGKDQMCFRSKQFFYIYQLFVYKKYINAKKNPNFQSCFRGLVDMQKVQGLNPTQDNEKKY